MFSQASLILSTGVKGACMAGEACIARGHARQGVCMVGACMVGGICVTGGVYGKGACMAGEMATAADSKHPTRMHSCYY